jgi:hypothetical protein
MLIDILKALSVLVIYMSVLVVGIALARYLDRRRRRTQGDPK